mmetsp:Transcript_34872/g.109547  ORF Transcript_34872/g.109547 Transcript_34872/m.109547 type:complete len:122 (-) Transcript_34872:130-495(-)
MSGSRHLGPRRSQTLFVFRSASDLAVQVNVQRRAGPRCLLKMQITIKQMTGETAKLDVEGSTTGAQVRKMLSDLWHVPEDQQKLSFGSTKIQDSTTLQEAGVTDDATVGLYVLSWTEVHGL